MRDPTRLIDGGRAMQWSIMGRVATVVHPHVEPGVFDALQENAGWSMDVELINGEAVLVPPVGDTASSAQGELYLALRRWQEDMADEGRVLQDVFVAFPEGSRSAPDISWWSAERLSPFSGGAVDSVPDLAVEVLSPSTRANDEGIKREVYLDSGVRELWLVDPEVRSVTRVRPDGPDQVLSAKDRLSSDLLAGFTMEIARIFRH